MLAAAPFDVEVVPLGVAAEVVEEGPVDRRPGRHVDLRELDAVGPVHGRPLEELERREIQGLQAVAVDSDLELAHGPVRWPHSISFRAAVNRFSWLENAGALGYPTAIMKKRIVLALALAVAACARPGAGPGFRRQPDRGRQGGDRQAPFRSEGRHELRPAEGLRGRREAGRTQRRPPGDDRARRPALSRPRGHLRLAQGHHGHPVLHDRGPRARPFLRGSGEVGPDAQLRRRPRPGPLPAGALPHRRRRLRRLSRVRARTLPGGARRRARTCSSRGTSPPITGNSTTGCSSRRPGRSPGRAAARDSSSTSAGRRDWPTSSGNIRGRSLSCRPGRSGRRASRFF